MDVHADLDDATGVLTISFDDGAKNALTIEALDQLAAQLDKAGDEVKAIVITGRSDIFTAGLDLKFIEENGRDGLRDLLATLGRTLMRLWTERRPTVCAAAGHGIAAGTMLAMACDHAIGAEGRFWWGLTETQIDFEMPIYGIALAQSNVRADRLEDLLLPGKRVDTAAAVEAGYLDEAVAQDQVLARAQEKAAELAQLPARAYGRTKLRLREEVADAVVDELVDDVTEVAAHLPKI